MCCRSTRVVIRGSPFLFPFKQKLPQSPLDSLWNTCENSSKGRRCGPRNPTTFPLEEHAPLQDASAAELQRAASHPSCLPCWAPLHSCPADTHPREKPRENTGTGVCFKSHLAALETRMKQPVILTRCCRAHRAHPIIHFLLAQLAGYRHGADSCGFSQASPYTTGHVNAWKKSAVCPEHSVTQIIMLMAQLGSSLSSVFRPAPGWHQSTPPILSIC